MEIEAKAKIAKASVFTECIHLSLLHFHPCLLDICVIFKGTTILRLFTGLFDFELDLLPMALIMLALYLNCVLRIISFP